MSLRDLPDAGSGAPLREISSRYGGGVLLVCRKCERKLKRAGKHVRAANLKKSLKKLGKASGTDPIHVIAVPCLKLCPKGAVTVCTQAGLAATPPLLTMIRTAEDIATLQRSYSGTM